MLLDGLAIGELAASAGVDFMPCPSLGSHLAVALITLTLCAGGIASPQRARACSGPFFVDIDTLPRTGDVDVPSNALLRVDDRLRDRASLDVELVPAGGESEALTLALDADTGYFVGSASTLLVAATRYELRVARAYFCAVVAVPPSATLPACSEGALDDGPVVIASFSTGDATDQDAPVIGAGTPSVSFGEALVCDYPGACCGIMYTARSVLAEASAWEASDDVAVAGYHLYRDGALVSAFRRDPFPGFGWQGCSGTPPSTDLQPGSYQVVAEDYAGRVSQASAPVTLGNGCEDASAGQCAVRMERRPSRLPVAALLGVLGVALLRVRRRPSAGPGASA